MVPLEKVLTPPGAAGEAACRGRSRPPRADAQPPPRRAQLRPAEPERTATALPPGTVRKKATGELGKVLAVDSRAGTATVRWLKSGVDLDRAALGDLAPLAGVRPRPRRLRYSG